MERIKLFLRPISGSRSWRAYRLLRGILLGFLLLFWEGFTNIQTLCQQSPNAWNISIFSNKTTTVHTWRASMGCTNHVAGLNPQPWRLLHQRVWVLIWQAFVQWWSSSTQHSHFKWKVSAKWPIDSRCF